MKSSPQPARLPISRFILDFFLLFLISIGIFFRFSWVNWSQGTNVHPDEYGLTSTLTALRIPNSLDGYFNTRLSPLSPYQKYDENGIPIQNGPDNRMRWGQLPMTIIRWTAEQTGNVGYDEIRLLGRRLSALADALSLVLIFLIGRSLYGYRTGLLAAALSSLAVMQIQQSHFMTVDNFGVFFATLAMYAAMRIAGFSSRRNRQPDEGLAGVPEAPQNLTTGWGWYGLFGLAFGLALACKINLLPLGGMLLVAAFLSVPNLTLRSRGELRRIAWRITLLLAFSFLVSGASFRLSQPMSFRAPTGETGILTLYPNPDWVESMKVAEMESNGVGGGPPAEQWTNRTAILFPLTNMVVWGMGLPLGLAAWLGFLWAVWRAFRSEAAWRAQALPLIWVGGYFLFMGTRWVKSMRYFLPIYPFLCLLAAWALIELWRKVGSSSHGRSRLFQTAARIGSLAASAIVIAGTLAWALAFVQAVYLQDHTRIQASRWIYQNVPQGSIISNENWDEGLPLPIDGKDPFGGLYQGVEMPVRWYDAENKRQAFLDTLAQVDYIILPSQRGIWSISRLPRMYPMTMAYYQALFDGRLGFERVATFTSPLRFGPLEISDVGGTLAWGETPSLPLFNNNPLAAEEAFSVYDHPPVWIFKKRPDFNLERARAVLDAVDLSQVVIQSPREASK
jgi:hypothetical protein